MVVFNFYAVTVIFPAMIAIDKHRRACGRYDLFCCFERYTFTSKLVLVSCDLWKKENIKLLITNSLKWVYILWSLTHIKSLTKDCLA